MAECASQERCRKVHRLNFLGAVKDKVIVSFASRVDSDETDLSSTTLDVYTQISLVLYANNLTKAQVINILYKAV